VGVFLLWSLPHRGSRFRNTGAAPFSILTGKESKKALDGEGGLQGNGALEGALRSTQPTARLVETNSRYSFFLFITIYQEAVTE
jgi:hypothetical protein